MKRIVLIIAMLMFVAAGADAQGFLKKIGKAVKDKTQDKTEETVDKAVDKVFDGIGGLLGGKKNKDKDSDDEDNDDVDAPSAGKAKPGTWTCPNPECGHTGNTGKFCDDCGTKRPDNAPLSADAQKSDFVPGEVAIFEDRLAGEQVGEFPSKWDLVRGYAEVGRIGGETAIAMNKDDSWISPLMKDGSRNYLGDVFTIEYDMLFDDTEKNGAPSIEL
ncbi:MAG: hypothetical protein II527_02275, partial [Bacteroidales bacterium]|nr:hypothetical protein [Bacteroidales bacterium]MBQ2492142.1 hypothetical protein [Bacteroidales bacterium]